MLKSSRDITIKLLSYELSLAVCYATVKRRVFLDMPCDIDGAFYIPIVVSVTNTSLEQALTHCRL